MIKYYTEKCFVCNCGLNNRLFPFNAKEAIECLGIDTTQELSHPICNTCQYMFTKCTHLLTNLQLKNTLNSCNSCGSKKPLTSCHFYNFPYEFLQVNYFKDLNRIDKIKLCLECTVFLDWALTTYTKLTITLNFSPARALKTIIEERERFWDVDLPSNVDRKSLSNCFVDVGIKIDASKYPLQRKENHSVSADSDDSHKNNRNKKLKDDVVTSLSSTDISDSDFNETFSTKSSPKKFNSIKKRLLNDPTPMSPTSIIKKANSITSSTKKVAFNGNLSIKSIPNRDELLKSSRRRSVKRKLSYTESSDSDTVYKQKEASPKKISSRSNSTESSTDDDSIKDQSSILKSNDPQKENNSSSDTDSSSSSLNKATRKNVKKSSLNTSKSQTTNSSQCSTNNSESSSDENESILSRRRRISSKKKLSSEDDNSQTSTKISQLDTSREMKSTSVSDTPIAKSKNKRKRSTRVESSETSSDDDSSKNNSTRTSFSTRDNSQSSSKSDTDSTSDSFSKVSPVKSNSRTPSLKTKKCLNSEHVTNKLRKKSDTVSPIVKKSTRNRRKMVESSGTSSDDDSSKNNSTRSSISTRVKSQSSSKSDTDSTSDSSSKVSPVKSNSKTPSPKLKKSITRNKGKGNTMVESSETSSDDNDSNKDNSTKTQISQSSAKSDTNSTSDTSSQRSPTSSVDNNSTKINSTRTSFSSKDNSPSSSESENDSSSDSSSNRSPTKSDTKTTSPKKKPYACYSNC